MVEKGQTESAPLSVRSDRPVEHTWFTYEALHDPLTGLYNQAAFDVLFQDADQDHLAVLIAQVDGYEEIRAGMGKDYADRLVTDVVGILKDTFRSTDPICRTEENEFVIIMTRMNSSMQALVFDKLERVNDLLAVPREDRRPVTLSVGVAFSDRPRPEGNVFQDAQTALRRMKQMRHCGCAVF